MTTTKPEQESDGLPPDAVPVRVVAPTHGRAAVLPGVVRERRTRAVLVGVPAAVCVAYLVAPASSLVALYQFVATWSVVAAWIGVRMHRPVRVRLWWALLAGVGCWVCGDALLTVLTWAAGEEPFPSAADGLYLGGYPLIGLGLVWLVRGRRPGRDRSALLDAAVVAVGVGVLATAFVVLPLAADADQTVWARVVGTAYPLGDVLLVGLLVRLTSTAGARTAAYRLLVAGLLASLVADVGYDVLTLVGPLADTPRWLDTFWLAGYVLLAATTLHPSMRTLSEPAPERAETLTRRRLGALALACALAPGTLLVQTATGREPSVVVCAVGSLLLSALVLVRMAGLLEQVSGQAVQLAALAALDGLTGVPNRRTWDHELSRACALARSSGDTLAVVLLDLDHFKLYNDARGHLAGDRLLKTAAALWTAGLRPGDLLARYGGEEFAVLLPACEGAAAVALLERLQHLTPDGEGFSAGVAVLGDETPGQVMARADLALYAAKSAGRRRVHLHGAVPATRG